MTARAEILKLKAAMARLRSEIDRMSDEACERRACCASCMFGSAFTEACDKFERQEAWLAVLESKAGAA